MIPVHTAQQVREAEASFFAANPDVDLMQRAADAMADNALDMLGEASSVLVAVGPGNNGGDGLFAAARLAERGCIVSLWMVGDSAHEAGLSAALAAGCTELGALAATEALADVDLLSDAVLGIGGRPGLTPAVAVLAAEAEALAVPVLAVDLPSGLDADSGHVVGATFVATRTLTFASRKPCHVSQPAASLCGEVHVADIGLDLAAPNLMQAEPADVARCWPLPGPVSDKYSRGVVGLDVGSSRFPGAGVLCTMGALWSGAGMIRFVGADRTAELVRPAMPSVTCGEGTVQAWVVGSGWGKTEANRDRLLARLDGGLPCVIDADALAFLPETLPVGCLLTPHAGELARLLGVARNAVEAEPLVHARSAAERWQATVLLKGATQYVVDPQGRARLAVAGPHWTGQAGSGDVLAGICGTLMASRLAAPQAGLLGASVQAMAALRRVGPYPPDIIARELAEVIGGFDPRW